MPKSVSNPGKTSQSLSRIPVMSVSNPGTSLSRIPVSHSKVCLKSRYRLFASNAHERLDDQSLSQIPVRYEINANRGSRCRAIAEIRVVSPYRDRQTRGMTLDRQEMPRVKSGALRPDLLVCQKHPSAQKPLPASNGFFFALEPFNPSHHLCPAPAKRLSASVG